MTSRFAMLCRALAANAHDEMRKHGAAAALHDELRRAEGSHEIGPRILNTARALADGIVSPNATKESVARKAAALVELAEVVEPTKSCPLPRPIERPDFHVTTDLRATSDPLWGRLASLRRALMDGARRAPSEWQSMLIHIRAMAHHAGLRPHYETRHIMATLDEAKDADPGLWCGEPGGWGKVVLVASGEDGRIELHDVEDAFTDNHKRNAAIEWAETWMNARERQLLAPTATPGPTPTAAATEAPAHAAGWREVQSRLFDMRDQKQRFPGYRAIARKLGCSDATVRKAVKLSDTLKGWQARGEAPKAAPKAYGLPVAAAAQTTEPAPGEAVHDDAHDAALARLLDELPHKERAAWDRLPPGQKREVARLYLEQKADQGRRTHKRA